MACMGMAARILPALHHTLTCCKLATWASASQGHLATHESFIKEVNVFLQATCSNPRGCAIAEAAHLALVHLADKPCARTSILPTGDATQVEGVAAAALRKDFDVGKLAMAHQQSTDVERCPGGGRWRGRGGRGRAAQGL